MDLIAMIRAIPGVGPYIPAVLVVFGIAAVLAAQLPPPVTAGWRSGQLYLSLYQLVNLMAQNYRHAENTTAPVVTPSLVVKGPAAPVAAALLLAVLTVPLVLGACSGAGSNPAADVAALEAGLTTAESLATVYIRLPTCTGTNSPLCSDSTIVGQIKTADAQAYTLVKAAEVAAGAPSALAAAEAAVSALTVITGALPTQGS
jgi:hypothetical protein